MQLNILWKDIWRNMVEIKDKNDVILARYIHTEDMQKGLSFFSPSEDGIQIGTWRYDNGKDLARHIHLEVPRQVHRTAEALCVIRGSLLAEIYDEDRVYVSNVIAEAGSILVLLKGGHEYHILEDNTLVYEIKNGPYVGADTDRERF